MSTTSNSDQGADKPLSPALERHLSDPAEMTEQVSGDQATAPKDETPTEPGVSTEQQPT